MKNIFILIAVLFGANVSASEITSDKDVTIKFKRIDNRVVLKADGNVLWDKVFHGAKPINIRKVIPHGGAGNSTKVRIEIYNLQASGYNPWSIAFQINSTPSVDVNIPPKTGNNNNLQMAWDYNFIWK